MVEIRYFLSFILFIISLNADNVINYNLRGKEHPKTGVAFNRLGFPIFESSFNCRLPFHLVNAKDSKQFRYCTNKLREYIKRNPEYKNNFTKQQLQNINSKKANIKHYTPAIQSPLLLTILV